MTEFVDLYPTLCELCGLSLPEHLEGDSFVALLEKPDLPWKKAVFSMAKQGFSMKTEHYRYTEWRAKDDKLLGRTLFDHRTDLAENRNLAEEAEFADLVVELSQQLDLGRGWQNFRMS